MREETKTRLINRICDELYEAASGYDFGNRAYREDYMERAETLMKEILIDIEISVIRHVKNGC
jgi:hypothetical protein